MKRQYRQYIVARAVWDADRQADPRSREIFERDTLRPDIHRALHGADLMAEAYGLYCATFKFHRSRMGVR